MKRLLVVLALCGIGCKDVDPYIVSGQAGDEVGKLFLEAVPLWKQAREQELVSELQYEKWKEFGERFKQLYPVAYRLWDQAVKTRDENGTMRMSAIIQSLRNELAGFLREVISAPHIEKEK